MGARHVMSRITRAVMTTTAWWLGGVVPVAGRLVQMLDACFGAAGHATSSTASHGANATAVGVNPAKDMTSR
jgi:hypothetical protein